MTKLEDAEAVFNKADEHIRTLRDAMAELDTAITGRDYPAAYRVIGTAFKASDLQHEHLEKDIAGLVDAINPENDPHKLTGDDIRKLILALGHGQPRGFSDKDAQALVDWAKEIRISNAMLDLILEGKAVPSIDADGDVLLEAVKS